VAWGAEPSREEEGLVEYASEAWMKAWPFAALAVAVACGGERGGDLFEEPGRGGSGASGGKGSGGSTAGSATGGAGAGATGSAGKAAGGKGGAAGGSGGSVASGGAGGGMTTGGAGGTGGKGGGMTGGGPGGDAGADGTGGSSMAGKGGGTAGVAGRGMPTGGASGTAGVGGAPPPTCDDLEQAYAETLESALECNPESDAEQCTEHVPSRLSCGCVIHVNPARSEAVAELKRLVSEHEEMGCVMVCPAIACVERDSVCTAREDGDAGRCVETDTPH
jgi:hypothetical protein